MEIGCFGRYTHIYIYTYIYIYTHIYTDLYPGKSKTVPPPILPTRLVRSLIKISMVQKPTSGEQYAIVCMHYLHITWVSKNFFNYSNSLFFWIKLTFETSASSHNYPEQIQRFVSEFCRCT